MLLEVLVLLPIIVVAPMSRGQPAARVVSQVLECSLVRLVQVLLLQLGRQRVQAAGASVSGDGGVEVSPLVSYCGEGLERLKGQVLAPLSHVE